MNLNQLSTFLSQNYSKSQDNKTLSATSAHVDYQNFVHPVSMPTSGAHVIQISAWLWPVSKVPISIFHTKSTFFQTRLIETEETGQRYELFCPSVLQDAQLIDPLPIRATCFLLDTLPNVKLIQNELLFFKIDYQVQLIKLDVTFNSTQEQSYDQLLLKSEEFNLQPHYPHFFSLQFNPTEFLDEEQRNRLIKLNIEISINQTNIRLQKFSYKRIAILTFSRNRKSQFEQTVGNSSRVQLEWEPLAPLQHRFQLLLPSDLPLTIQRSLKSPSFPSYARLQRMHTKTAQPYLVGESIALKLICSSWLSKITFYYVVQANGRLVWTGTLRMNSSVRVFRLPALRAMVSVAVVALFSEHVGLVDFLHLHVELENKPKRKPMTGAKRDEGVLNDLKQDFCLENEIKHLEFGLQMLSNLNYLKAQMPHNRLLMQSLCSTPPRSAVWMLAGNQIQVRSLESLFRLPRIHWLYNGKKVINIF